MPCSWLAPIYHCGPRYSSTACPYMHALLFSVLLPLTAPHKRLRAMRGPPSVSVIWQFFPSRSWAGSRGSQWRGAVSLSPNSYNRTNNTFSPSAGSTILFALFSPLPATLILLITVAARCFLFLLLLLLLFLIRVYVIPIAPLSTPPPPF